MDGATLAINKINAAGGIKGFQIELVALDDQCSGDQSPTVAQKLLDLWMLGLNLGGSDILGLICALSKNVAEPSSDNG